jgi:hypothetical protein
MNDQDEMREAIAREREALRADMARRREQLEREEVLAEARQAIAPSTKGAPPPRDYGRQRSAAPAPSSITRDWQDYIKGQLDRRDRAILRAVAVAVIEEEKARIQELAELRDQVAALTRELAELRGRDIDRRLRAVPSPTALIA